MEGLKVLNLTAVHPHQRAGIVVYDFHKNLEKHGCESKLLTMVYDHFEDPNILTYRKKKYDQFVKRGLNQLQAYKQRSKKVDTDFYFNNEDLTKEVNTTKSIINSLKGFTPDVIVIHFAQGFLTSKNIAEINKITKAPIFWYLMDMKPMTGGCAYAWDCDGYQKSCGNCPALFSDDAKDLSFKNLAFNAENIANTDLSVITASEMTRSQVMKSTVFKNKPIHKLYLAINSSVFRPISAEERSAFADQYQLDASRKHLFFGAVKPDQKRKGFKELMASLKLLEGSLSDKQKQDTHLLVAGEERIEITNQLAEAGLSHTFLGFLNHEELAKTFAFSNGFLCPTLQDAGPMMVNQSLMSGTPVVAFEMGVCIDLVAKEKGTGVIVELGNTQAFAEGILDILNTPENVEIENRKRCRELALEIYSYDSQFKTFKAIIEKSLSTSNVL